MAAFLESDLEVSLDLSLLDDSFDEIFFFFPVLKSVSYHPLPFNLNDGAEINFERLSLLHFGQVVLGSSLIFWITSI